MPWVHKGNLAKTPEQIIREVEESNARPGLKVNICAQCRIQGKEPSVFLVDEYSDHIRTHTNQGDK
jgi:hypothetical protein